MNDEKEKKLFSLMAPRRHEAFWERQKNGILEASQRRSARAAWLLAPAAAAALLLFLTARPHAPAPVPEQQLVSEAFLENLDMLDDMDVLEAVPENEL